MPEKFEVRHLDIAYDERLIVKDLNIHPYGENHSPGRS